MSNPYPVDYCPCEDYPDCTLRGEMFCWIHCEHEVTDPDEVVYLICFECGHTYRTKAELEQRWFDEVAHMGGFQPKPAELIFFCQECIHDF